MSEIRATTISDLVGTGPVTLTGQYAQTVRIQFDGTGTISITDSENCSSITDVGNGTTTINFTNAHADANYSFAGSSGDPSNTTVSAAPRSVVPTTSALRKLSVTVTGTATDVAYNSMMVSGDLA